MHVRLRIWRQERASAPGRMETFEVDDVTPEMSLLEVLDRLNDQLVESGARPVGFDHDCREGICGQCGFVVDGHAHGPTGTTTCQVHMRSFPDGATLHLEPFRARAMPVLQDLMVDRSALDRIIEAGGYVSTDTGSAPEANAIPVAHDAAEDAFDAAACIGCGACVAACPNASAMLFVGAKVSHLSLLPQGKVEASTRVRRMVAQMDEEGFGACSSAGSCAVVCPKGLRLDHIARLGWERLKSRLG